MRNLRAEMVRRELTAEKLANMINMPVSTLYKKLQGHSDFTIPEAFAISKALNGLQVEYLFTKEELQDAKTSQ